MNSEVRELDEWGELVASAVDFRETFAHAKERLASEQIPWYPYDSLANFALLDGVLQGENRSLPQLSGGRPILDLGCADGATSFFLASLGYSVDVVDYPLTNYNSMRGVAALNKTALAPVNIHTADLDSQFSLPRSGYGLTLFLGLLYHLKNPFFVLERLSHASRFCFLSTRIAKFDPTKQQRIENLPVAYLVSPTETNNDATNFWIFSRKGLERIIERSGWTICGYKDFGNTTNSDPASNEGDERAFCLLKSTRA